MEDVCVVYCTAPDEEVAARVARALVEERLAACVNVLPAVVSFYRWEGELHEDGELLLVVKTRRALLEPLAARVRELHPYEVPELIALPVEAGSAAYLAWVRGETRAG